MCPGARVLATLRESACHILCTQTILHHSSWHPAHATTWDGTTCSCLFCSTGLIWPRITTIGCSGSFAHLKAYRRSSTPWSKNWSLLLQPCRGWPKSPVDFSCHHLLKPISSQGWGGWSHMSLLRPCVPGKFRHQLTPQNSVGMPGHEFMSTA